jgi:hypothetical protein
MRTRRGRRTPAENAPLSRGEAIDALIDVGVRCPGLRMDLRAVGEGYSVLIPVEQMEALSRAYAGRKWLSDLAADVINAPAHPEVA